MVTPRGQEVDRVMGLILELMIRWRSRFQRKFLPAFRII